MRHFGAFTALELVAPQVAAKASPGQFVMVTVPGGGFLLRRPLSLFTVRGDRVGLLVEARGAGSERLAALEVGDAVDLAGPLGQRVPGRPAWPAPCSSAAASAAPRCSTSPTSWRPAGAHVTAAFGFRDFRAAARRRRLRHRAALGRHGGRQRGPARARVLDLLAGLDVPPQTVVYACGPSPMIAAVQRWTPRERPARLRVARGPHGLRHGLVPRLRGRHARGKLRVCSEGPVFALDEVRP